MTYRHIILDRDGVLNREAPNAGYNREPGEFFWLPGSLEALALLQGAGLRLTVATNQSGVGRGLMTLAQLEAVHARMREGATRAGVKAALVRTGKGRKTESLLQDGAEVPIYDDLPQFARALAGR